MRDSRDDISTPRRQAAVMAKKSDGENTDGDAPARDRPLRDVLLVALTVASGAVDAISYFGLGKIFCAFMTGNIVFLGFGIGTIGGPDAIPVIVALSMF